MQKLYGTVVPIVTPLTDEDTIDVESLKSLVDYVIDGGLQCLYPCGTTGEMMYLTVEERKLVAEVTVAQAAKRVPVFVHVGAWNLKDTIELAQHAEKIGADGIGVVTPAFYKLSDQGLIDFYVAVANSVSKDFPVYMYAIPQNAINDVNAAVCEAVAKQCPNVLGIKYSYPDFTKLQQFLMVNDEKFSVLVGPDHLFEALCAVGGDGVVSGNAMIVREHYKKRSDGVELWRTYSDAGYLIRQVETGAEYSEAIDVANAPYTYTETDKIIPDDFDIETASVEQLRERLTDTETAAKILLGEEST